MIGRRQLPVYSPLTLAALGRAFGGTRSSGGQAAAEELQLHLTTRFGADDCWLLDSGTHALQVALLAAVGSGNRVAVPAYCCFDIATAALGADVDVLLYDVDPSSLTPDLHGVQSALREGATALVAANLYGHPLPWTELRTLCEEHGAALIEDAAQGVGSEWNGRPGGSFGDLTVLSFGRGKGWTGGGGGALLSRDASMAGAVRRCWEPAWSEGPDAGSTAGVGVKSLAQWLLGRPLLYGLPASLPWLRLGETVFKEPTEPRGIDPLSARLALETSAMADREVSVRRSNAEAWEQALRAGGASTAGIRPCDPLPDGRSAYLRWPVLLDGSAGAMAVTAALAPWGVASGYPTSLSALPELAGSLTRSGSHAGAETLTQRLVTFPTHSLVTDRDRRGAARTFGAIPG